MTSLQHKTPSLYQLTWPIFIELLLFMLMGNIDTFMLSAYSDESVAAVGVSNQILALIVLLFGFITAGTSVLVAQYRGARENQKANELSYVSILVNLIFGLILSGFLILNSTMLLKMMDLPSELMGPATSYTNIVGGFIFFQALIMTLAAILRSNGFTKESMIVTILMNVLNVIGNAIFIFGLAGAPVLGEVGVAISTSFSRMVAFLFLAYFVYKRLGNVFFMRIKKSDTIIYLKKLLKIGVPSAGEQLSYQSSQIAITFFISSLGTIALTTKVYATNVNMFVYLCSIAIGQGTMIIIGQMVGAGKFKEAYERCVRSLKISILLSIIFAVVFSLAADPIFRLFTSNEEIIAISKTIMMLTIILEPGRAYNIVVINSLRAAGDVKFPVYIGILSMWGVAVPLSYLLGIYFELGLPGIWIAFATDEWLRGILMYRRWRSRKWEKYSLVQNDESKISLSNVH